MEIKLTPEESEDIFYNALCNALGYMQGYGIRLDTEDKDYDVAVTELNKEKPGTKFCYEDVLMKILKMGNKLIMEDIEGEGAHTRSITLKEVHERVQKTPLSHLQDAIDETGDVITDDVVLQTVFYEEIIFG